MATLQNTTFGGTGSVTLPTGAVGDRPTPAEGMLRYNNVSGTDILEFYDGVNWRPVTGYSAGVIGSGGNETYFRNNGIVHLFTATGANTFTPTFTGTIQVLVVGGGGGSDGPSWRGGGGGGGVIFNRAFPVTSGTPYPITVGAGGGDGNGQNSVFSALTAIGGGQSGRWDSTASGLDGGSGGGGGNSSADGSRFRVWGGLGTNGQGFPGGSGVRFNQQGQNAHWGGAGGGAGGPGHHAPDHVTEPFQECMGGPGAATDITGTVLYFGGGGGGGAHHGGGHCNGGIGGGGGGSVYHASPYPNRPSAGYRGNGGGQSLNTGQPSPGQRDGGDGGANTGGGNGGGDYGAAGGSGVVIIRY